MTAKQRQMLITYGLVAILIIAIAAAITTIFPVRAHAQSTTGNTIRIAKLCVMKQADPFGCALINEGKGPFTLVRHMSAKLYTAQTEAKTAADRTTAQTLFEAWSEELDVQQVVKVRFGGMLGNNAGVLLEQAWLVRLAECKTSPCPMLKNTGLLNRTQVFLSRIYAGDRPVWSKLGDAEKLLGRGI